MQPFSLKSDLLGSAAIAAVCCFLSGSKLKSAIAMVLGFVASTVCGAMSGACAGELGDAFAPIKDSTSNDPAGFQLMVISIGILVVMVGSIFTVTMIYMIKGKKPRRGESRNSE